MPSDPRSSREIAVVVLAAGEGTRMRSRTPKVLHPLAGLPLLAHVLRTALALEPAHLVTVVRHERDRVAAAVLEHAPDALVVDQDETPGTGRAVEAALAALPAAFAGDVVVLSGDVPLLDSATLRSLVAAHTGGVTLLTAILDDPTGFGRVLRETGSDEVLRIVEQKDASPEQLAVRETNAGVYVFARAALERALAGIGTANAQGEKYLTDAAASIRAAGLSVRALPVDDTTLVAGINDRAQLSAVARSLNARIVRDWQLAGVTVQDPATTWIDVDAKLARDVTLRPGTEILGATVVEEGATVGPDTTLTDCEVGADASVIRTQATLAVIGAGATVGPFSYLRPGTVLGDASKIGAFVEAKNARLGRGTKVPHLSYVGDIEIGEESNIGAGTIVANYDGEKKHRTVVGSHVRLGAHNVYRAPVRIGDGVYSAAGTVIRKDVPDGALVRTYALQENIEGWTVEHRPGSEAARAAGKTDAAPAAEDGE